MNGLWKDVYRTAAAPLRFALMEAKTRADQNDENILIVKGNRRVADIYLGEFMRLYSHHAFRESVTFANANPDPKPLRTDAWWRDYFGESSRSLRREFFG